MKLFAEPIPTPPPQPISDSPPHEELESAWTLESQIESETPLGLEQQIAQDQFFSSGSQVEQDPTPPFIPTSMESFAKDSFLLEEDPGFAEIEEQLFAEDDQEDFSPPAAPRKRRGLSLQQWMILAILAIIEIVILVVFVIQYLQ
jgi:hypothetical protein